MNVIRLLPIILILFHNHDFQNRSTTGTILPTSSQTSIISITPIPSLTQTPNPTVLVTSTPIPVTIVQPNKDNELLSNFLTTISTMAAAISAIAAMIAIMNERKREQEARESKRAFFTVFDPGIKPLPQSPPFRIQINLKNIGLNPASDLTARIYLVEHTLSKAPQYSFNFTVGNLIEYNSPTPWYNDTLNLPINFPPHFIVLGIRYKDALLGNTFRQIFFMRWDGVINGLTHPDFVHASIDQKNQLLEHLRDELKEFTEANEQAC